jgi:hypothetical protein
MAAWSPSSMTSDSLGMCAAAPWLEDVVDFAALENYPGEFLINAWNLREQKMRVFMKKEVSASHFRAALAFPLIYPPFELDGDHYIEGSAMDTLNLQGLLRFDEDYDAGYQFKLKERLVEILPEIERILGARDANDPRENFKAVEALVAAAEHAARDYAFSRDKRDAATVHRRKDKELDRTRAAELQKLRQISPAARALERESRQESEINAINKIIVFDVLGTEQLVRRPRNLYDAWVQQMIVPLVSISNENIKLFENQYDTGYGEEGRLLHRLRFADQIPLEHWPNVLDWSYSNMTTLFDAGYRAGKQFYRTHSWLAKGTGDAAG